MLAYTIQEDIQSLNVCVALVGIIERNVTVTLSTLTETAQGWPYTYVYHNVHA